MITVCKRMNNVVPDCAISVIYAPLPRSGLNKNKGKLFFFLPAADKTWHKYLGAVTASKAPLDQVPLVLPARSHLTISNLVANLPHIAHQNASHPCLQYAK